MVGAVSGTPGTNPTLWQYVVTQSNGLNVSIVGTGTENGINYIDYRFNGITVASPGAIVFAIDATAASTGQIWTNSIYWKLVGGTTTGIVNWLLGIIENTSGGGAFVGGAFYGQTAPTSASLVTQRPAATRTLSGGATVGQVQFAMNINVSGKTAIDFTIRLGMPQMEQGSFVTSVIPTTASTVTRSADRASMEGTNFSSWYNQSEGSIVTTYQKNSSFSYNFGVFSLTSSLSNRLNVIDFFPSSFTIYYNGNPQVYEFGGPSNITTKSKSAFSFSTNKFFKCTDGTFYLSNMAGTGVVINSGNLTSGIKIPTVNTLVLGPYWGGVQPLNGTIARFTYYPRALKPNQLQYLTQ
jgi:hypothetical protein